MVTTEGYAGRPGGAQAKFLAEVGAEEEKRNLGLILDGSTTTSVVSGPRDRTPTI